MAGTPTIELRWWRPARTASRLRRSQWLTLTRTGSLMFGEIDQDKNLKETVKD